MKILLTGATGFLGNNIARLLVQQGHEVTCLVRTAQVPRSLQGLNVQPVYADFSDAGTLNRLSDSFEVLIHAAALIQLGWSKLAESREVNVAGTLRLAEFCRQRGKRMVHVSTVDTLAHAPDRRPVTEGQRLPANPACSYVVSKLEAEDGIQALVSRGLDAVIVHPGFMVGPFDWKPSSGQMMLSIARGLGWLAPGGGCSIVDVRAVANGVWAAAQLGRGGDHYILAGHNLTYWEIWQEMARIVGVRGPRGKLPVWLAELVGGMGDLSAKFRRQEPLVNSASTAMGQLFHWYSSAKAQSTLGYEIPPWQPALQDAWDWFGQVGMRPGSPSK